MTKNWERREACCAALLILLGACGSEPRVPTTITLNPTSLSFTALGQTQQLTPSVSDQRGDPLAEATVSWSSSDAAVVIVSSTGLVTAQGSGTTQVTAASGSASAAAQVTVTQTPTQLSKISGDGQTGIAGQRLDLPLVVEVQDAQNNPVAGATVVFEISQGGGRAEPASVSTLADGRASTTLTTGPVAGIPQGVSARIPVTAISVSFTARTTPGPPASISMASGNNEQAAAGNPVPVRPAVVVRDANANAVAGLTVEFEVISGGGSITGSSRVTDANGRAEVGSWILGAASPNLLRATAAGPGINGNPATFTASTSITPFNIEVRFLSAASPAQIQAFTSAEQKWERLVVGDLPNLTLNEAAGSCRDDMPAINETVDDVIIFARLQEIDGPGGTLGRAGPCFVRDPSLLPLVGVMFFDVADLNFIEGEGLLEDVILHEMGHVLGFGSLWPDAGLLAGGASSGGVDPHFTGPQAIEAFNDAGGTPYTGAKVPVENRGGPGTIDSHWRESVFDNELMTGFIDLGTNPLSAVSTASLADQGYEVDLSAADAYSLTPALGLRGTRRVLPLGNDVLQLPIRVLDSSGRLTRTLRR